MPSEMAGDLGNVGDGPGEIAVRIVRGESG